MHDDTIDSKALNDALMRGDLAALDALGFFVPVAYLAVAYRQHAMVIGRGVETFTHDDMRQAMVNWVLAGHPRDPS